MKFTGGGVKAAELAQLESLQLHHCGVGDDDLAPLAGMPKLKSLFVSSQFNGRLTDAGLKHLAQIHQFMRPTMALAIGLLSGMAAVAADETDRMLAMVDPRVVVQREAASASGGSVN